MLLVACGDDKAMEPLDTDATILAFGDSLTRGKGVSEADSYPAALSRLIGRQVINEGVSGEISEHGAERFPDVFKSTSPDLLLLMHGGNDILQNIPSDQTAASLSAIIELAQSNDVPILMIAIPEKSLFSNAAPVYRELAEKYSVPLEDSIISSLLKKPAMKSDSVHFNKAGYQAIAERVRETLAENGAL